MHMGRNCYLPEPGNLYIRGKNEIKGRSKRTKKETTKRKPTSCLLSSWVQECIRRVYFTFKYPLRLLD
jgi:hypothetical protein